MRKRLYLGLDIGTSGLKAALVDIRGEQVGWATEEYAVEVPQPGWAEQDPATWLAAARRGIAHALRQAGMEGTDVAAVGLAGQMHSLVCLDETGAPTRPAILWADQRSARQAGEITSQIGADVLAIETGNALPAGFMLPSWTWLREHEPQTAARTRWLLSAKDYVRFCLTGQIGAEPSDASATGLFNPHTRQWSAVMRAAGGVAADQLAPLSASTAIAGELLPGFGLPAGLQVIFGGSDVAVQAFANGVLDPGQVSCTIGTGGQLFSPCATPTHDPQLRMHLFCHVMPERWHHEAATLTAGLSLRWLRDQLTPGSSYQSLADAAAQVSADEMDGLFFLPFLAGERTPYMNAHLRGGFVGMGLHHTPAHLTRAVMEGVVFSLREGLGLLTTLGHPAQSLLATGGAATHALWLQLQADIFQLPIETLRASGTNTQIPYAAYATARGAALMAGVSTGALAITDARPEAKRTLATLPNDQRMASYQSAYHNYQEWAKIFNQRFPERAA